MARLQADVDRFKQELRDQRQLIFQLMQAEQQRYDIILKYLQAGGGPGEGAPPIPPPPSPGSLSKPAGGAAETKEAGVRGGAGHEVGTVSGHVRSNGQPIGEVYVYVDGIHAAPVHGRTLEIKQRDKQFAPRVAVVPVGTRIIFPNQDTVIHNVFSQSPGNTFDLGSVKGGETSTPVVLLKSGPVEIFCNIHSKMRSDVLVVPNGALDARGGRRLVPDRGRAGRDPQDRPLEPDAEAGLRAGRGDRQGGNGDLQRGGERIPPAHEQARPGLRLVR